MTRSLSSPIWCVDSSVLLRAILGQSPAAKLWLKSAPGTLVGSKMLEVETRRVLVNLYGNSADADGYLAGFTLVALTDEITDRAAALPAHISGADALHLATAMKLGSDVTLVTHDFQQATAAKTLKQPVFDPVSDDPNREPAA